jgi:GntR family transcriptional regulator, vanillate catabolism transcriptional regulator
MPFEAGGATVVANLRQLIINGRYPAGTRMVEIPVAADLGVSRTPIRIAFRALEREGLLERAGKRGYIVRAFSEEDVRCAIEVRGVLEGLAARELAERGMSEEVAARLRFCIEAGDDVLSNGRLDEQDIEAWSRLNGEFHSTILQATGSRVIADAIARNDHLPFASADSLVIDRSQLKREFEKLRIAQLHHRLVFEALTKRESARVEALMREHAQIALRYLPHI